MEQLQDVDIIISSLQKERNELSERMNSIDRLIKKIKYGSVNLALNKGQLIKANDADDIEVIEQDKPFPIKSDLKVQVIKVLEILGEASKLKAIQDKYKEITGQHHNLRETVRNLNKHEIFKLLQPKGTLRGLYWVKAEWLEDDGKKLKDKHKFAGFDLLFSDDMVEFK